MTPSRFPIRAVSKLTGLSIEVIRSWERRYQVVTPERDSRGRIYNESDIERLQLLRVAVNSGQSIGQVAALKNHELKILVEPFSVAGGLKPAIREDHLTPFTPSEDWRCLLDAVQNYDHLALDQQLRRLALLMKPLELIRQVALPIMEEVGEQWVRGKLSIAQEHLMSASLRNFLGSLMQMYTRSETPAKLLFATPSGEFHELGLIAAAMLTAAGGLGYIYLGANVPAAEIIVAAERNSPRAVVLGIVGSQDLRTSIQELRQIALKTPPAVEIWVGGKSSLQLGKAITATRAQWLPDFDALAQRLQGIGAKF